MNRKKLLGILMAMALIVCESVSVLANGSKSANPIYSGHYSDSEEIRKGTTVFFNTGTDKKHSGITFGVTATGGGEGIGASVDADAIKEAIETAAKGGVGMLPKKGAKKVGCTFKGFFIKAANGKMKKVKKLTLEMLEAIGKGTLTLEARFKPKKFKVSVRLDGLSGNEITLFKKKYDITTISGNSAFTDAEKKAKEAAPTGMQFVGFSTVPGSTTADFTEALNGGASTSWYEKTKKVVLYPVYTEIVKKDE